MSILQSPGRIRIQINILAKEKGRPSPDAPVAASVVRAYASALMACDRRDLVRDARFLCTIFLSAMRSITACDSCRVFRAAALSPAAIDLRTFFTAERSADLRLALRLRVASACRAR